MDGLGVLHHEPEPARAAMSEVRIFRMPRERCFRPTPREHCSRLQVLDQDAEGNLYP